MLCPSHRTDFRHYRCSTRREGPIRAREVAATYPAAVWDTQSRGLRRATGRRTGIEDFRCDSGTCKGSPIDRERNSPLQGLIRYRAIRTRRVCYPRPPKRRSKRKDSTVGCAQPVTACRQIGCNSDDQANQFAPSHRTQERRSKSNTPPSAATSR